MMMMTKLTQLQPLIS